MLKSRNLAQHTKDDGFREIQLNGKQLVFLFMVATVFSAVAFLCGLFVGRGVRPDRAPSSARPDRPLSLFRRRNVPEPACPHWSDPTARRPPAAVDELGYSIIDKSSAPAEELKPAGCHERLQRERPPSRLLQRPRKAASPLPRLQKSASAGPETSRARGQEEPPPPVAASEPSAVAASKNSPVHAGLRYGAGRPGVRAAGDGPSLKDEADTIARRLSSKAAGLCHDAGRCAVDMRVVSASSRRREAEAMATKLKKEEQFTPWITR